MSEVEKKRTPVTDTELLAAIERVYPLVFGREPTTEEKAMYLAHIALETRNLQSLYNYNVGNVSSSGQSGNYWRPPWYDDPTHKHHARMKRGEVPQAFKAYATLDAGVQDYLGYLSDRPAMVKAARKADPYAFARAIKATGYTPDIEPNAVGKSLASLTGFRKRGSIWPLFGLAAGIGALAWLKGPKR